MKFPFNLVMVALFVSTIATSQEKCDTPNENTLEDLNSISITKCSIDDVKRALEKDNKQISVRKHVRKSKKNNISIDASNKVEKIKSKNLLVQKLNLKNDAVSSLKKIPFHLVEQIPLFSKCKNTPLLKQSKCFETYMIKHIVNNFNYPKKAMQKGIEGKVLVQFTIGKDGKVKDIKKRGPKNGELLKKEAERLISKLPTFIPGKHKGNLVNVKYALPIIFKAPKKS
ncbi:energy transducer TonB [Tenacibaculum sp. S7007]|uniref:Energy transducer TonB n=1 Tax=Tenacibaculum pelagium TaxID=2759527 RepID=A0A839APD2_9FLAO|nr:energy transducer TonB [Tenacibaculum pelagium]MBA6156942.1 energy transducer TonB [Tenacibaculum pelagium]